MRKEKAENKVQTDSAQADKITLANVELEKQVARL